MGRLICSRKKNLKMLIKVRKLLVLTILDWQVTFENLHITFSRDPCEHPAQKHNSWPGLDTPTLVP
jgi:hypothetical protein